MISFKKYMAHQLAERKKKQKQEKIQKKKKEEEKQQRLKVAEIVEIFLDA